MVKNSSPTSPSLHIKMKQNVQKVKAVETQSTSKGNFIPKPKLLSYCSKNTELKTQYSVLLHFNFKLTLTRF